MILIYYKTWIYQCLIKQVKSPSTWSHVPNSVRIRHLGRAGNRGMTSWDTKPAYDGSRYKIAYLLFCDCGQGLGLSPLGEVIYCDDDEFALTLSNGQRSQYIQAPLLKGPGTGDRRQGF